MRYPQLDNATEWRTFLLNTELQIDQISQLKYAARRAVCTKHLVTHHGVGGVECRSSEVSQQMCRRLVLLFLRLSGFADVLPPDRWLARVGQSLSGRLLAALGSDALPLQEQSLR